MNIVSLTAMQRRQNVSTTHSNTYGYKGKQAVVGAEKPYHPGAVGGEDTGAGDGG